MPISDSKTQVKPTSKTRKQVIGVAVAACIAVATSIVFLTTREPDPSRRFVELFEVFVTNFADVDVTFTVEPHIDAFGGISAEVLVPASHAADYRTLYAFHDNIEINSEDCYRFLPPDIRDRVAYLEPDHQCRRVIIAGELMDRGWWVFRDTQVVSSYFALMEERDGQVLVLISGGGARGWRPRC